MDLPPDSKRAHLRRFVSGKRRWSEPLSAQAAADGFKGWHERGYLPHCDKPGLVQFVTFRLSDSIPEARRGEWEHLLRIDSRSDAPCSAASEDAQRERRVKLEEYLDLGLGECLLREPWIGALAETALLHHRGERFRMIAWVVMPNHVHALIDVGTMPLTKIVQNWKSLVVVAANRRLGRNGRFWQPDYWDRFMRNEEQRSKAIRYIENNPVKAKLCRVPEEWPFSSARFRNPKTLELHVPK
jgi:REP element-mobilizing transposase RayT